MLKITGTPPSSAKVQDAYKYKPALEGKEPDRLYTWSWKHKQEGGYDRPDYTWVDGTTGLVTFWPTLFMVGSFDFAIQVKDDKFEALAETNDPKRHEHYAMKTWTVVVAENDTSGRMSLKPVVGFAGLYQRNSFFLCRVGPNVFASRVYKGREEFGQWVQAPERGYELQELDEISEVEVS